MPCHDAGGADARGAGGAGAGGALAVRRGGARFSEQRQAYQARSARKGQEGKREVVTRAPLRKVDDIMFCATIRNPEGGRGGWPRTSLWYPPLYNQLTYFASLWTTRVLVCDS
jgi:hypothetical protein